MCASVYQCILKYHWSCLRYLISLSLFFLLQLCMTKDRVRTPYPGSWRKPHGILFLWLTCVGGGQYLVTHSLSDKIKSTLNVQACFWSMPAHWLFELVLVKDNMRGSMVRKKNQPIAQVSQLHSLPMILKIFCPFIPFSRIAEPAEQHVQCISY